MKKIVALVLALALALSLCTVAMAKETGYRLNKADDGTLVATATTFTSTAASTTMQDGKLKNGTVAFDTVDGVNYVLGATTADADYILYKDGEVAGYAYKVYGNGYYVDTATAFTNFGTKCGTWHKEANDTKDYYTLDGDENAVKYYAVTEGATTTAKVGNTVVGLKKVENRSIYENPHAYLCNFTKDYDGDPVVTKVYCKNDATETFAFETSFAKATAAFGKGNFEKVAFGADGVAADGATYAVVYVKTASAAAATTTTTVDSSKTFDAGVAMYVGLSLMSVAGSAVVIGKKKEF